MTRETERIDAFEDPEKPERRHIPLLLLLALFAICATVGVFAGFASGALGGGGPTEQPPQTEEPVLVSTVTDEPITQPPPTAPPTEQVSTGEQVVTEEVVTVTVPSGGGGVNTCRCGDGVCCPGEACEADCGGACTGPCCDNGGVQWQGEVCVCPGVVDRVTYCNDGSKTDQLTDRSCQPAGGCSGGDGNPTIPGGPSPDPFAACGQACSLSDPSSCPAGYTCMWCDMCSPDYCWKPGCP